MGVVDARKRKNSIKIRRLIQKDPHFDRVLLVLAQLELLLPLMPFDAMPSAMKDPQLHHELRYCDVPSSFLADDPVSLDALKQLNETVSEAFGAYLRGQADAAASLLQAALPQLLQAMGSLGVDPFPEDAIDHRDPGQRLVHIDGKRVEIRVNDELRGSWSIWSVGDLKEACRLAEEFDCGLVYSFEDRIPSSRMIEER